MPHTLAEKLLPRLSEAFPHQRMQLGSQPRVLATYRSPHPEVGCAEIHDDDDEITIYLGDRTHVHFGNYNDQLSADERAEDTVNQVIAFLDELFADQIEFFGNGCAGGCRNRDQKDRGALSKLFFGKRSFVWSGPLT
jgi:hypothetical protein